MQYKVKVFACLKDSEAGGLVVGCVFVVYAVKDRWKLVMVSTCIPYQ